MPFALGACQNFQKLFIDGHVDSLSVDSNQRFFHYEVLNVHLFTLISPEYKVKNCPRRDRDDQPGKAVAFQRQLSYKAKKPGFWEIRTAYLKGLFLESSASNHKNIDQQYPVFISKGYGQHPGMDRICR